MLVIKRIKIPLTVKYFVLNWEKRWKWFDFPWWVWMSSLIMLVWLLGLVKTGVPVLVFRFWETVFSLKNFDLFKSKAGLDQPYFLLSISLLLISVIIDFLVPSDVLTAEEQRDIMLMIARRSPVGTPISINILPRRSEFTIIAFIFYHKITNHSAIAGWFRLVFRRLKFSLILLLLCFDMQFFDSADYNFQYFSRVVLMLLGLLNYYTFCPKPLSLLSFLTTDLCI